MFWFVRLAIVLVLIVVVIMGLGYILPDSRTVKTTSIIDAEPARVYEIVADVDKQRDWRSDVQSIQVESHDDLRTWTVVTPEGISIHYREKAKQTNERYEVEFESLEAGRGGWVSLFEPVGDDRTKLTCIQTMVIPNPFMRVFSYLVMNSEAQMDAYLQDLSRRAALKDKPVGE